MVADQRLHALYSGKSTGDARAIYDDFAPEYDTEILAKGYTLHLMGAAFVARHLRGDDTPILDAGCGTGLLGDALATLAFTGVHAVDLSPGMLALAERRGVYASLSEASLTGPLPFEDRHFSGVVTIGSLGPGHAPPESLKELSRVTGRFCPLIFSVREDTYEAQGLAALMGEMEAAGTWRLLERSPAFRVFALAEPDLFARIFVYEVR